MDRPTAGAEQSPYKQTTPALVWPCSSFGRALQVVVVQLNSPGVQACCLDMHGMPACLQSTLGSPSQQGAILLSSGQVPASAPPEAEGADRLTFKPAQPSREAHLGGSCTACPL